jgi:hypothetical protein
VRIINDAYNASPDSMAAALRTLAQITVPGERTVAVLGAMSELGETGDEHDRIGLLAVRLNIQRIVVVGAEARRLYLAAVGEGSWTAKPSSRDADEAFEYPAELRDGDRVLVKSSNSAGSGTSAIVWENRSREIPATAAAISLAFTLLLTPLFIRLFEKLGWGRSSAPRERAQPQPPGEAGHADGRRHLHPRHRSSATSSAR